ncbi:MULTISPECIES: site-specific integrase [unclassified Rhizobium]|uniref:site-specific integrase n=1 Tax=unclassified Rhizobium TaxID=2613769 RepID=UPI000363BDB7|nr:MULTISPECIES: site-specific integrase [unclassified Rhizobium]MBD9449874.1 tyrosine-type recombinase/integrase [Rhizobium sp. RHZ01]
MLNADYEPISKLRILLTEQRYSPVVIGNYCAYARGFLDYLAQRDLPIMDVSEDLVAQYLQYAIAMFRERRGCSPGKNWHSIPRSGIHALLRLAQGQWPSAPKATCAADALRFAICEEYETWLREERGLAAASIDALMWEGRNFLAWQLDRHGPDSLMTMTVGDIDCYMDTRSRHQTRKSVKDVAERLRSMLRYLHRTGRTAIDLSPHVVAPLLYAYEGVPSILTPDQVAAVLQVSGEDKTPVGLRDLAILQLLATYGLRSGEICNLRIEDIDWRTEAIRIRHTKTRAYSFLPLMAPVGEAVLAYLQAGRPVTDAREIFVRTRAPYRKLGLLASMVRRRLEDAGIKPAGKSGSHIFRHARAVEMLRAAVPQKVIGDLLGHRSAESTAPYLKLATEDLRAIALDVPGQEVRS